MNLDEIKTRATELSPWAHMATVGTDGAPDVVPVHPAWEGDTMWVMASRASVKVLNIANEGRVALHWQVTATGDGVEVWGNATVVDDVEVKRRLWNGVFDYDLSAFSPGGPDGSPDSVFISIQPTRAMYMKSYGMAAIERWTAGVPQ